MQDTWRVTESRTDPGILIIHAPNDAFFYCDGTKPQDVVDAVRRILNIPTGKSIVKYTAKLANALKELELAIESLTRRAGAL